MEVNVNNVNAASVWGANVPPQPTYHAPAYEYAVPSYGYACPEPCNDSFVLIVVLFILLIIVGACYFPKC
ncbi:YjcZ family sporulation protein [Fredinandcohnia quinoae]|uniref:YjcZ family sporulation protein n=1 Tax=Fredinandcohnia quinoae TaxID=2918902 RepID=UPI0023DC6236|nr:YjcZ family sporulation protein [Fredinandcohnia sp. SECRCQ15]